MKHHALPALIMVMLGLGAASPSRADAVSYQGIVDVEASVGGITCRHHHDWSRDDQMRLQKIMRKADLFSAANTAAWLSCSQGDVQLFKTQAPALTKLVMSDDGRFVVGVSNIKLRNPVQIAIWETESGTRVFATMVGARDACFTPDDYRKFLVAHPVMRAALAGEAVLIDGVVHASIVPQYADQQPASLPGVD